MNIIIIIIGMFIFLILVLGIGGYDSTLKTFKRRDIHRRLNVLSGPRGETEVSIVQSKVLSDIPWLNNILSRVPRAVNINRILKQAGIKHSLGFFLLLSLVLGVLGLYFGWHITRNLALGIVAAGALGLTPSFYIRYRKIKRARRFERQLPDALESLCRALRAGHALSSGLQMVGRELPDPIGSEFAETFAEINYGVSVPEALENLATRVDCKDLGFFVVSVVIQRETGGNLAETLENAGYIIRERFKLLGRIKALAAEGIYSAWVLGLLPFIVASILFILNRDYVLFLVNDPSGKKLSLLALVWLFLGIFFMRKIVRIKV